MDCSTFSFDLHVLGTPPALILSQDQTLVCNLLFRRRRSGNRLSTESIDKPYLVRSLEINLKYLSHDWHVQPVVNDPIAFSALGGAFGERRSSFTLRPPVLETPDNIAGKFPSETQSHDPSGTRQCRDRYVRLVEVCFARRFDLLAERAILLTFPDLPRSIAHRQKVIRSN